MYKEWLVDADQWQQEYWAYKDGSMVRILHDNKCGSHEEILYSIEKFVLQYNFETSSPFPEIIEFLSTLKS